MSKRHFSMLPGVVLALLCASSPPPVEAGSKVRAYVINDFDASGPCKAEDRSPWSSMVGSWYYTMGIFGGHTLSKFRVDGDFTDRLLCDPDSGLSGCKDYDHVDAGDFVMIGTHGGHGGDHWIGSMRNTPGSSSDCTIETPDASGNGEMFMGDNQTEFLHFSSCNSMNDDYMPHAWRLFEDPADSPTNGRRLHLATGFHGMMGVSDIYSPDYFDLAFAGQTVSVKDAWMDSMHHPEMENIKCPVAYAVGTSKNNCFNRIDQETYLNVFADPSAINHYCYYFFDKCDPAKEGPFTAPE